MAQLYIGLMSGTSVDGIDAALVDLDENRVRLVAFHYQPFTSEIRQRIQQLSQPNQPILLKAYGELDSELGRLFAETTLALLKQAGIGAARIKAIGSHGQTVYHAPDMANGFSLQIGDPNRIAEITGITTLGDFRRRDIAVGGQGAPLVPAFHRAVFALVGQRIAVLNIGGIANLTMINGEHTLGFDTGPGNTLVDYWHHKHRGEPYDANGDWAASGLVNQALLSVLKDDPYFDLLPPKSTGKEYFSPIWLEQKLAAFSAVKAEDVQATLCRLTADSIIEAISRTAPGSQVILVCGGGIHNRPMMQALQQGLPMNVSSTAAYGIDPDHVEAMAFAWLAKQTLENRPGNLCSVTGARAPVILGGIYPGRSGIGSG